MNQMEHDKNMEIAKLTASEQRLQKIIDDNRTAIELNTLSKWEAKKPNICEAALKEADDGH
jgi:hypothetical protein